MNKLQMLISELEDEKEKAFQKYRECDKANLRGAASYKRGSYDAFSLCIQKLTLLLNDESKQPQPSDFANTMLGEVPPIVNDTKTDSDQTVEGATPIVRQNEQTKEVCQRCKLPRHYTGGYEETCNCGIL